jgi:hypothetical protein
MFSFQVHMERSAPLLAPLLCQSVITYHILHLVGDVNGQVCGAAASAPGDVTEQGPQAGHPVLPVKQVLDSLQTSASYRMTKRLC